MKKKGFTLVELIAAIAIFAIAMASISLAFSNSINTWSRSDLKLGTSAYAQSIVETIRSQGANKIKNMYTDNSGNNCYIYFDDSLSNLKVYNGTVIYPSDLLAWAKDNSTKLSGTYSESFTSCNNSAYSEDRKYGASIFISKASSFSNVYYVRVKVWDLKRQNGAGSESLREIYLSR